MFSKPLIFVIPSILVIASGYSPVITFYVFPVPPYSKNGDRRMHIRGTRRIDRSWLRR
jgi:hypothetical protein